MADTGKSLIGAALKGVSAGLATYAHGMAKNEEEKRALKIKEEEGRAKREQYSKVLRAAGLDQHAEFFEMMPLDDEPNLKLLDELVNRRAELEGGENEQAYASLFGQKEQMLGPGLGGFDFTQFALNEGVGPAYGATPGGMKETGEALAPYAEMLRGQEPQTQKIPGYMDAVQQKVLEFRAQTKANVQKAEDAALGKKPKVELSPEQKGREAGLEEVAKRNTLRAGGYDPPGYETDEEKTKKTVAETKKIQAEKDKEITTQYKAYVDSEKSTTLAEANKIYLESTTADERAKVGVLGVNTIEDLQAIAKNLKSLPGLKRKYKEKQSALGVDAFKKDKSVTADKLSELFNRFNDVLTKDEWLELQQREQAEGAK